MNDVLLRTFYKLQKVEDKWNKVLELETKSHCVEPFFPFKQSTLQLLWQYFVL